VSAAPKALRAAPAYQVYASDDLAGERFFALCLAERGLLDSMRRGCWVSDDSTVPADPVALSVVVRRPEAEVSRNLTTGVLSWFIRSPDGKRLLEPDLQRQRIACETRRQAQSQAADATNRKRWQKPSPSESVSDSGSVSLLNRNEKTRTDSQEGGDSLSPEEIEWSKNYSTSESNFPAAGAAPQGQHQPAE
jgi:hypothetical protein